ncbi:hypothetical protein CA12_06920 [Alienimonas californiensis]|uniref:Helix-turn-helix domain-containing protein n=1 Tax=Alienimonas californiensis TaxID=2527989 RepID=A0A517P5I0_9PLAN|nr:hypothetical protein CA12_06920 [Alienimonas californiensis]
MAVSLRYAGKEMSEMSSDCLLMTKTEEFLGVSQNTLRIWIKQGERVGPVWSGE